MIYFASFVSLLCGATIIGILGARRTTELETRIYLLEQEIVVYQQRITDLLRKEIDMAKKKAKKKPAKKGM